MKEETRQAKGINCGQCIYFSEEWYECHKDSPTDNKLTFATVTAGDWCGDFISAPTKKSFVELVFYV